MGLGLFRRLTAFRLAPRVATNLLAFSIAFAPVARADSSTTTTTSTGTSTGTSVSIPPPAQNNQAGAQQNVGNSNNLASMLSTALGVVSMAAGGLSMAKGAMEISNCMKGQSASDKSGDNAGLEKASLDKNAQDKVASIGNTSGTSTSGLGGLSSKLIAGSGNSCLDGAIALATGGLMMLSGIMGLAAGKQAGQTGAQAMQNASGMSSVPGDLGGTSPTGSNPNSGSGTTANSLGAGNDSGSQIKLDPALLRTGTANEIMGQFEQHFGIGRDNFAQGVVGGQDPRALLAGAPMNPLKVSDMNKAFTAAQNMSQAQKDQALAGTPIGALQAEMKGKMADGGGGEARKPASSPLGKVDDTELVALGATSTNSATTPLSDLNVSSEVREALLARQQAESKIDTELMNLFDRVHLKYRDKTKMIFGYDPSGVLKGVGNAEGN